MSRNLHLRHLMDLTTNVRNVTIMGSIGQGKSTLRDSLLTASSITSQGVSGDVRATHTRVDEEPGRSIKSTCISLNCEITDEDLKNFKGERRGNEFLINLIDSPGLVELSYEVTAALRVTDGAILVVDPIHGIRAHTQTVLLQALSEMIQPVVTLSKMDKFFLGPSSDGELAYMELSGVIQNVNVIIATCVDTDCYDWQIYPGQGNLAFSSALQGWAFTLAKFAKIFASQFGMDEAKMKELLWGENFFDPVTNKWTSKNTGSATCKRGFVQFCYEPIKDIIDACMNDQKDKLWALLENFGVVVKYEDKDLTGKALMKHVMQTWLPESDALLEMMICHLPSPVEAQKYRVKRLYTGPLDDAYANAIRNCDPNGPLMVYVSKMILASDQSRFFAFGRVFSGKVSTSTEVRIMTPNYVPGEGQRFQYLSVQRTFIWMGKNPEPVEDVPCGNIVAIAGLDDFISKNATITDARDDQAHPIHGMKFSVSPVISIAVTCRTESEHQKLVKGLKSVAKFDPMVVYGVEESGELVLSGAGELQLDTCLLELQRAFSDGAEFIKSKPVVSFRETVTEKSSHTVNSKSPNKHNSLCMVARPLTGALVQAIDEGRIGAGDDPNVRAEMLTNEFGWDRNLAKKIWCFGPGTAGSNMVVDACKGGPYVGDIKSSVVRGFQSSSNEGALAAEIMRGTCFDLCGASLHSNASKRRSDQIVKAAERVIHASQLTASPRFLEPVYLVEIRAPKQALSAINSTVSKKKFKFLDYGQVPDSPLHVIKGFLPISESIGLSGALRAATSGQALADFMFDHWDIFPSDPLAPGSSAAQLAKDIRRRKGLKEQITPLYELEDEL